MGEIYVIISGYYSDWAILGYTITEEDAKKVCADYNSSNKDRYEAYYQPVGFMEPKKEIEDAKERHCFRFGFCAYIMELN